MTEKEPTFDVSDLSEEQIQELWEKFYPRLRASIAERVQRMQRPVASNSEIALSAFHSLLQRAKEGQFPDLSNEAEFWSLLRTIAVRKANDVHKALWAKKRGGSAPTLGSSQPVDGSDAQDVIATAPDNRSAETVNLEISDLFTELLQRLPNERYRDVILLKLQGADTETIADCLSTTQRTVQRLLKNIRIDWEEALC